MNLFATYRTYLIDAVTQLFPHVRTDAITLEPPRDPSHGDLATNAAMVLAGHIQTGEGGASRREIAEAVAEKIRSFPGVQEVIIAGPGFINIRLDIAAWQGVIPSILQRGIHFGDSTLGAGKHINVEYVSANPTGPMHVGHARGAVYGDALATLLKKAGYRVTKEYYINDAGGQVVVLAESALLRYREACGEAIGAIPEGLYPGEYLKEVGAALYAKHGKGLLALPKAVQLEEAGAVAIEAMMHLIKTDLAAMGIHHDIFTSEKALRDAGKIEEAIAILEEKSYLYRGVLEAPKGEKSDDWEPQEQLLFRSSALGDDADRTVAKSDGNFTYFAGDLALTRDKIARGYDVLVYMFGADHGGYVKRMEAAAAAFSDHRVPVDIKLCQLVHLTKNGEPVKMSKRAGNFVTVRDVLDDVGKDILRFVMLMRKTTQDMEFDLEKVHEQSRENPVFYVHYAHARARSVIRLGERSMPDACALSQHPDPALLHGLSHPAEMALIQLLAAWPRLVEQAAMAHEPHRVIYYLHDVASAFHGLWNVGHGDAGLRFIQPEAPDLTAARLALARAVTVVIASGLAVCGVEPVEELRA